MKTILLFWYGISKRNSNHCPQDAPRGCPQDVLLDGKSYLSYRGAIFLGVIVIFLFSMRAAPGEEAGKKEKDIYAISYLAGYRCYGAMAGKIMLRDWQAFMKGYKSGFAGALIININESAFDRGYQDAKNNYPSKYNDEVLKWTEEK